MHVKGILGLKKESTF